MEEACYVYGTLGCDEQMWDYEGKAADVDVIFEAPSQGARNTSEIMSSVRRSALTLRIPNPVIEREMRRRWRRRSTPS